MNRRHFVKGAILTCAAATLGLGLAQTGLLMPENQTAEAVPKIQLGKVLFAYYSLTGHTRGMVDRIHSFTGGDIFEIATVESYNGNTVESVGKEQVRTKSTPELKNHLTNTDYDVLFIGSPIWWYSIAPPVLTFIRETKLAGKIIVPFCTYDGNYGRYFDRIAEECASAKILTGRDFQNAKAANKQALTQEINAWLTNIKTALPT